MRAISASIAAGLVQCCRNCGPVLRSACRHFQEAGMKLPRRQFLHLTAAAAALPAVSRFAGAQSYPTRAVHLIEGFGAGGAPDIVARLIGQSLSEQLGQSFVVQNRSGASSSIATEAVVRASPDGYTLLLVTTANAVNATMLKLKFDFVRDIAPVAGIVRVPLVMEVHPSVSARTAAELIAYAKANPGKVNFRERFPADWSRRCRVCSAGAICLSRRRAAWVRPPGRCRREAPISAWLRS
jgi:Tripartite tricarboxylate transporter family receptor